MQIISAGSSLIFLQADLSKTSNNRLPILSKMEIILLNSLADPKSGSPGSPSPGPERSGPRSPYLVVAVASPPRLDPYVVFIPVPDHRPMHA